MHAVVETSAVVADCDAADLSDAERHAIIEVVATNPRSGVVGHRRCAQAAPAGSWQGKSGGSRRVTFFAADDVPVFLLAPVDEGERADLSQGERNALRGTLGSLVDVWRAHRQRPERPRR